MKVFVTDAQYKHALGAIRCLGRHKIEVIAGSHYKNAQGFYSKFTKKKVVYPDPRQEKEFINFLLDYVKNNQIDVLLPIGYTSTVAISKHLEEFEPFVKIPVAPWKDLEIAAVKDKTMDFARNIGVMVPESFKSVEDIKNYPVVVKAVLESGHIQYVNSVEELKKIDISDSLIQEYVQGDGYGFFALMDHGVAKAIFMHKRRREYPITGGASTSAESVYDEKLKDSGLKLLQALNWHGIAMVEFKKDKYTGEFKLMEINPKFWGSLDLAIASGVEFPYLAVKMAMGESFNPVFDYKKDTKYRWLWPDDTVRLFAKPSDAGVYFADFFNPKVKHNIWLSDFGPNWAQFKQTIYILLNPSKKKDLKYPHGVPKIK